MVWSLEQFVLGCLTIWTKVFLYNFKNKLNSTNASNEDDYDYNYDMKTLVHRKVSTMNNE